MTIFDISFFGLHIAPTWYGLSYAIGFIICYFFIKKFFIFHKKDDLDTLLFYAFLGIIIGGRVGYVLLYNLSLYIENPIQILYVWKGGMSFHGGLLGVILSVYLFSKKYKYHFWQLIDTIALIIPAALGLGRIGNWINNELPGYTPYDGVFPMYILGEKYFPSPLLEMILEGIVLLLVMLTSWKFIKNQKPGIFSGIFLTGYSIARIIAEQYRLPDSHIGYLFSSGWITLGILYSVPMFLLGIYLIFKNSYFIKNS